jgi:hypothetical protein
MNVLKHIVCVMLQKQDSFIPYSALSQVVRSFIGWLGLIPRVMAADHEKKEIEKKKKKKKRMIWLYLSSLSGPSLIRKRYYERLSPEPPLG